MQGVSRWSVIDLKESNFCDETRNKFVSNKCAGLRISGLITTDDLQTINDAINDVGLEYFEGDDKGGAIVRKGKLGPNFYRFKDDPLEYFRRTRLTWPIFANDILSRVDLYSCVQDICSKIFDMPSQTAEHQGKKMMGCTVRELGSAPIHRDWMPGESDALDFAEDLQDQIAWNFYLKMPDAGGETVIYRANELSMLHEDIESAQVKPLPGDLIIFRSTQLHEVLPSHGGRMTLSGFFGPTSEKLLFWV